MLSRGAFVIGGNHHNALGVIRSLGEKGIKPFVIIETKDKNPYILKSKYIQKGWLVRDEQQVLELLESDDLHSDKKHVLIACSDNHSSLIIASFWKFSNLFYQPTYRMLYYFTS